MSLTTRPPSRIHNRKITETGPSHTDTHNLAQIPGPLTHPPDAETRQTSKLYFKLLQAIHHKQVINNAITTNTFPQGMMRQVTRLTDFIKPAAPTEQTKTQVRENTINWMSNNMQILLQHYSSTITALSNTPQNPQALQIAIGWARKRYTHKLTPETIHTAEHILGLHQQHLLETSHSVTVTNPPQQQVHTDTALQTQTNTTEDQFPPLPRPQAPHKLTLYLGPRSSLAEEIVKLHKNNPTPTASLSGPPNSSSPFDPLFQPSQSVDAQTSTGSPLEDAGAPLDPEQSQIPPQPLTSLNIQPTSSTPLPPRTKTSHLLRSKQITLPNAVLLSPIPPQKSQTGVPVVPPQPLSGTQQTSHQHPIEKHIPLPDPQSSVVPQDLPTPITKNRIQEVTAQIHNQSGTTTSSPTKDEAVTNNRFNYSNVAVILPDNIDSSQPLPAGGIGARDQFGSGQLAESAEQGLTEPQREERMMSGSIQVNMTAKITTSESSPNNNPAAAPLPDPYPRAPATSGLSNHNPVQSNFHKPIYHLARPNRKLQDWHIKAQKPVVVLGDSNINRIPPHTYINIQLDSYPGAHIYHLLKIMEKAPINPHTKILILSIGLNNRDQDPKQTSIKQLRTLYKQATSTFPNADIYIPKINYSRNLTPEQQNNLHILNTMITTHFRHLTSIPPEQFNTEKDNIHWKKDTARYIFESWCNQLDL